MTIAPAARSRDSTTNDAQWQSQNAIRKAPLKMCVRMRRGARATEKAASLPLRRRVFQIEVVLLPTAKGGSATTADSGGCTQPGSAAPEIATSVLSPLSRCSGARRETVTNRGNCAPPALPILPILPLVLCMCQCRNPVTTRLVPEVLNQFAISEATLRRRSRSALRVVERVLLFLVPHAVLL